MNNKEINTESDGNLNKQLEQLRNHLDEVVKMSNSFRLTADLSPSFENFLQSCEEVRNRLHIHEQSGIKHTESNDQLQKFIDHLSGAESLAKECKNLGILSAGIDSFIKACQNIKIKMEESLYLEKSGSVGKEESMSGKKLSGSNTDSSFFGSIKNFLSACKFFKIRVDDSDGKSNSNTKKLSSKQSKDPLSQVIDQINETEKLTKEAKKKGYVMSNSAEKFIKSCEKIKKQLKREKRYATLTSLRPIVKSNENIEANASKILEMVDKLNFVGLISDSIENYLRSQLIAKGCIDNSTCNERCGRKEIGTNTESDESYSDSYMSDRGTQSDIIKISKKEFVTSSEQFLTKVDMRKCHEPNEIEFDERNPMLLKGQTLGIPCKVHNTVFPISKSIPNHQKLLNSSSCSMCNQTKQKTKRPQDLYNCCKITSSMDQDKKTRLEKICKLAPVASDKNKSDVVTNETKNGVPCKLYVCDCVNNASKNKTLRKSSSNSSTVKICGKCIGQKQNNQLEQLPQRLLNQYDNKIDPNDVIVSLKNITDPTKRNDSKVCPPNIVKRQDCDPPVLSCPIKKPLSNVTPSAKTNDQCIDERKNEILIQHLAQKLLTGICPPDTNLNQVDIENSPKNIVEPTEIQDLKVCPPIGLNREDGGLPNISSSSKMCDNCIGQKKNEQLIQRLSERMLTCNPSNTNTDQINIVGSCKNKVDLTAVRNPRVCPPIDLNKEEILITKVSSSTKVCSDCVGQSENDQFVQNLAERLLTSICPPNKKLDQIDVIKALQKIAEPNNGNESKIQNNLNRRDFCLSSVEPAKESLSNVSSSAKICKPCNAQKNQVADQSLEVKDISNLTKKIESKVAPSNNLNMEDPSTLTGPIKIPSNEIHSEKISDNCCGQNKNDQLVQYLAQKLLTGINQPTNLDHNIDATKSPKNKIEPTKDKDLISNTNATNKEDLCSQKVRIVEPDQKTVNIAMISSPYACENKIDDEKPESSHCEALKKMDPDTLCNIDNCLGLFEMKLHKIIRVTRTLDVDGKVCETKEVVIREGSRHKPQITEMDDVSDDNPDAPLIETITTTSTIEKVVKQPHEL